MLAGFAEFTNRVPEDGLIVINGEDLGIAKLKELLPNRRYVTFGFGRNVDFQAMDLILSASGSRFRIRTRLGQSFPMEIGVPGLHNVLNATACFALAGALGLNVEVFEDALTNFRGVARRFSRYQSPNGFEVIDDYAHHPTEIMATMGAASQLKSALGGELITILQPHRYTSTRDFFDEYGPALKGADRVYITEVFASSEKPIEGVCGNRLADKIKGVLSCPVEFVQEFSSLPQKVAQIAGPRDIVLLMGAGNITDLVPEFLQSVVTPQINPVPVPIPGGVSQ